MSSIKKQLIVSMCAMLFVVCFLVYGTLAYFTDSVSTISQIFGSGSNVSCKLIDKTQASGFELDNDGVSVRVYPGMTFNKTVAALNTGGSSLYIRVALDKRIVLSEANVGKESQINEDLVIFRIDTENWEYRDGYYYYKGTLASHATTPSLIQTIEFSTAMGNLYKGSKLYVKVTMDAVQASHNGANAWEAEGWHSVSGGED